MKALRVTVGTTATEIASGTPDDAFAWVATVLNPLGASQDVWIGGADVNTSTLGFPLAAGASHSADLQGQSLYGRVASGTQNVYVIYREGSR